MNYLFKVTVSSKQNILLVQHVITEDVDQAISDVLKCADHHNTSNISIATHHVMPAHEILNSPWVDEKPVGEVMELDEDLIDKDYKPEYLKQKTDLVDLLNTHDGNLKTLAKELGITKDKLERRLLHYKIN